MILAATGLKREAAALERAWRRARTLPPRWGKGRVAGEHAGGDALSTIDTESFGVFHPISGDTPPPNPPPSRGRAHDLHLQVVTGGGDSLRLARELTAAAPSCSAIISIGLCGALAPELKPGDWVVGTQVACGLATPIIVGTMDEAWAATLAGLLPGARLAPVYASDTMLSDLAAKARAREVTGAAIVDMESHVAALVAARFGLPFAVARVVSDGAGRSLPPAAQAGMAADGRMDVGAVLKALAADPGQLPALIRVGIEAGRAFRALERFPVEGLHASR